MCKKQKRYYTCLHFTKPYQGTLRSVFIALQARPALMFEEVSRTPHSVLSVLQLTLILHTHLLPVYSTYISEAAKYINCILCFCTIHFNIITQFKTTKHKVPISIVKPTRYTNKSNLFYFVMTLCIKRIRDHLDVTSYYVLFHFFYAQHQPHRNSNKHRNKNTPPVR